MFNVFSTFTQPTPSPYFFFVRLRVHHKIECIPYFIYASKVGVSSIHPTTMLLVYQNNKNLLHRGMKDSHQIIILFTLRSCIDVECIYVIRLEPRTWDENVFLYNVNPNFMLCEYEFRVKQLEAYFDFRLFMSGFWPG